LAPKIRNKLAERPIGRFPCLPSTRTIASAAYIQRRVTWDFHQPAFHAPSAKPLSRSMRLLMIALPWGYAFSKEICRWEPAAAAPAAARSDAKSAACAHASGTANRKSEARNPKYETKKVGRFVSDFVLRISAFTSFFLHQLPAPDLSQAPRPAR